MARRPALTAGPGGLRGLPHDRGAHGPASSLHGGRRRRARLSPRWGSARPGARLSWSAPAACTAVATTGERAARCSAIMVGAGGLRGRPHDRGGRGPASASHGVGRVGGAFGRVCRWGTAILAGMGLGLKARRGPLKRGVGRWRGGSCRGGVWLATLVRCVPLGHGIPRRRGPGPRGLARTAEVGRWELRVGVGCSGVWSATAVGPVPLGHGTSRARFQH